MRSKRISARARGCVSPAVRGICREDARYGDDYDPIPPDCTAGGRYAVTKRLTKSDGGAVV